MTENKSQYLRERIIEAIVKKRACNARAQQIVESLLNPQNDKDSFLSKLKEINPGHYDDIVDERHVLKLCGYPLCKRTLDNIPTHKYRICTTKNKVYDLTERKKYCSGQCFKASQFIKEQIPDSPLWLRDIEIFNDFKLLDINT